MIFLEFSFEGRTVVMVLIISKRGNGDVYGDAGFNFWYDFTSIAGISWNNIVLDKAPICNSSPTGSFPFSLSFLESITHCIF